MTKAEELQIIDEAIGKLGRDSYLGPWLGSVRAELEAAIRSDLFPAPMLPAEAYRQAVKIGQAAEERANEVLALAQRRAAEVTDKARQQAEGIIARAYGELRAALKRLEVAY